MRFQGITGQPALKYSIHQWWWLDDVPVTVFFLECLEAERHSEFIFRVEEEQQKTSTMENNLYVEETVDSLRGMPFLSRGGRGPLRVHDTHGGYNTRTTAHPCLAANTRLRNEDVMHNLGDHHNPPVLV